MTDIDIIMITKNSVEPCLDESLKSIAESVKISGITPRLIVVDSNSNDETLEFIDRHKELNPLILFDEGNRATARQKGIERVFSELFAFIDSDVVLTQEWFSQMIPYFEDPKVGAVWGAAIQTGKDPRTYGYTQSFLTKAYERGYPSWMKPFYWIRRNLFGWVKSFGVWDDMARVGIFNLTKEHRNLNDEMKEHTVFHKLITEGYRVNPIGIPSYNEEFFDSHAKFPDYLNKELFVRKDYVMNILASVKKNMVDGYKRNGGS